MPNQPKTPTRTVRIDDELWAKAGREAYRRNESISDAVRAFLVRYSKPKAKPKARPK